MYSADTVKYKERSLLQRLKPENTKIKGPEPSVRKKYRDWTGKYHKTLIAPPESAYNRPLKRIVYDTWTDTRGIWINR